MGQPILRTRTRMLLTMTNTGADPGVVHKILVHAQVAGGVGQASRAHIFAESAAQNPYIFRITGLRVYRPAGTAGVNLNKVRR